MATTEIENETEHDEKDAASTKTPCSTPQRLGMVDAATARILGMVDAAASAKTLCSTPRRLGIGDAAAAQRLGMASVPLSDSLNTLCEGPGRPKAQGTTEWLCPRTQVGGSSANAAPARHTDANGDELQLPGRRHSRLLWRAGMQRHSARPTRVARASLSQPGCEPAEEREDKAAQSHP